MKAIIKICCDFDHEFLGKVPYDTADFGNELKKKVDKIILAHRQSCPAYRQEERP